MCKYCELRKWDPNHHENNEEDLTLLVHMGIVPPRPTDTKNRIAIWGCWGCNDPIDESDDENYYYYFPKYCPECGEKLI